ncbi:hypothetical protein SAMN05444149_101715 [Pseudosulfitobacter pseudonitzschiae]|uniref:hypothetical protein n=1 Tax=Pseudosulfitobacter pseudonitzschiae TaxID=1402135 RepID=UPI00056A9698|nr:hypothetical protein [Pseudosulfitobacter pseudonitzschiae]QKS08880.1 hypothetical protein HT745_10525 [Pseudosulfitobacter pseudonitzschiae]SHE65121.1 hypothetical protein SAMN05444149_101715 [Pseudosulfitobacter pseudonitzschiae]
MIKRLMTAAAALVLLTNPLAAAEADGAMTQYASERAAEWLMNDTVVAAIKAQNARTAGLSAAEIDSLDKDWRAQVGQAEMPLIASVLDSPLSVSLTDHVADARGTITEMFIMDAQGLNVAASAVTSDYWQGDEAKFQKTYGVGPDAVHISEVELDESTQTYQAQVSLSLTDPATGEMIGAVTFGLDAQAFY